MFVFETGVCAEYVCLSCVCGDCVCLTSVLSMFGVCVCLCVFELFMLSVCVFEPAVCV